ncbi:MAG: hypothetical protein SWH61_14145 [Thermodesulfobacteriota bacterium]|nr:hypothetical protein [Thermodesulfobacteriota bacterium]
MFTINQISYENGLVKQKYNFLEILSTQGILIENVEIDAVPKGLRGCTDINTGAHQPSVLATRPD